MTGSIDSGRDGALLAIGITDHTLHSGAANGLGLDNCLHRLSGAEVVRAQAYRKRILIDLRQRGAGLCRRGSTIGRPSTGWVDRGSALREDTPRDDRAMIAF